MNDKRAHDIVLAWCQTTTVHNGQPVHLVMRQDVVHNGRTYACAVLDVLRFMPVVVATGDTWDQVRELVLPPKGKTKCS